MARALAGVLVAALLIAAQTIGLVPRAIAAGNTPLPAAGPPRTASSTVQKGIIEASGNLFSQEQAAGFSYFRMELNWTKAEPLNGLYDENYFAAVRSEIANARAHGLTPILGLGLEYAPYWVFGLDPRGSRFVDQYGDIWTGAGLGQYVANGVFSQAVRSAEAGYIQRVFQDLGTDFAGVNWGGGLVYDELRYPACPAGRTNCYWAYDVNAQAADPAPGYVPGTGNAAQAATFLTWYLHSLQDYVTWGMSVIRQYYSGQIVLLMPSWGIRPGDIQNALNSNLNGSTYRASEVAAGLDWADQLPAYAQHGSVLVDCTWANRLDDPWNDAQDWSPVHYLSTILPSGMQLGGENSYGAESTADMTNTFNNAHAYGLRWVMWMNEASTQVAGDATLQQIGAQ